MIKSIDTIQINDFLGDPARALKVLRSSEGSLVITEDGEPAAVIFSTQAYEQAQHERELLMLLARGEKEIASGEGYDLDAVLQEADLILQGSES